MKGKKILSISIATACLLMNTPLSVFAVGNTGANEVRFTDTSSAADIQVAVSVPQTAAIPAVKAAAVTPTTAEPYTLTAEDVDVTRCREDDNDSNTPYMDAVQISWRGVTDLSQPQYKNIVIPDTLPFDKPFSMMRARSRRTRTAMLSPRPWRCPSSRRISVTESSAAAISKRSRSRRM